MVLIPVTCEGRAGQPADCRPCGRGGAGRVEREGTGSWGFGWREVRNRERERRVRQLAVLLPGFQVKIQSGTPRSPAAPFVIKDLKTYSTRHGAQGENRRLVMGRKHPTQQGNSTHSLTASPPRQPPPHFHEQAASHICYPKVVVSRVVD